MPYPRQLNLGEELELKLSQWLQTELNTHYAERETYIQRLLNYQRDYWAEPSQETRTFPFYGASNIVVPLTAICVEAVHARAWMTLFPSRPFVYAKTKREELMDVEKPLEEWIDHYILTDLKAKPQFNSLLLNLEKYGTGIGKAGYIKEVRKAVRSIEGTDREEEFTFVRHEGATVDPVACVNFLMRLSETDPQSSTWCGEEHFSSSRYEFELMERSGLIREGSCEKLEAYFASIASTGGGREGAFQSKQDSLEKRDPIWPSDRVFWQEIWCAFDVDGDDESEEIQVLIHRESGVLLAIRHNWYRDVRRPYRVGQYIPVEHRWTGVGIAKQNEQFQLEITTIHRQRIDNATLANMRMFKVNKMTGYGPKEPVFPGKMWFLDEMDHIEPMQLGEVYPSSFSNEQSTLMYSQQRTGIHEVTLGMPQAGTPGTATSDIARIQEGKAKFDFVFHNMRDLIGDLVNDVVVVTAEFGTRDLRYFDLVQGGDKVAAVLFGADKELIYNRTLFDIGVVGQQRNRAVDRGLWQEIAAYLTQYYTGILQLAQISDPGLAPVIARKGMAAVTEAFKQILEAVEIRNIDRIIMTELLQVLNNAEQAPTGATPLAGGNGRGETALQELGVADLLKAVSVLGTGRTGLPARL